MIVILAEKPNVAEMIAASLKEIRLSNGEILESKHLDQPKYQKLIKEARKEGYFRGTKHIVTYAYGHLLTLKEPDEIDRNLAKWQMDTLPFHFNEIPIKVNYGPRGISKKQLDIIKKLLNDRSITKIFVATDPDREGENIFRLIYQYTKCIKPFERLWIKDWNEYGIIEAYKNRKHGQDYHGLADAARCRQEADYLVGMNLTRAMTLKYGGFKNVLSIGRVQTPTLAILVNREKEIQHFIPEDFWTIKAVFQHPHGKYEGGWFKGKEDRFTEKEKGEAVLQQLKGKDGILTEVKVKEERERNPLLFNLTGLQKAAGKVTGLSPAKVLEVAQKLYDEYKLITYPRSSSNYIATGTGKSLRKRLEVLATAFPHYTDKALQNNWNMQAYFINDSKTTSHEAIIPTLRSPQLAKLSKQELAVYEVIVKRFVSSFYPVCIWEQTTATTSVGSETFKSSGKTLKQAGWREIEGIPKSNVLPSIQVHDAVKAIKFNLEEKKTQPPKRILEEDMPSIMDNAGKFINDEELREQLKGTGIGTEATRSSIIEELVKRGYVRREKKYLVPTEEKGMALFKVLPVEILKSAEMTAVWEQKLADVEAGKITRAQFMEEMKTAISQMVNEVKSSEGSKLSSVTSTYTKRDVKAGNKPPSNKGTTTRTPKSPTEKNTLCVCPSCGKQVLELEKSFSCTGWKEGCKVTIWKNAMERFGKKKITKTEAKQLLTKQKTTKKIKLHSPTKNKDYEAYLILDQDYRVKQSFD
ncbi:DNA topoisomerase [Caldalkalibacillus mannanilyticus]|uniref:DNA topoisomerase n=1 Tax=Caldalkalibacillus mannanilyticus TaxID=1418 RepID=UPI0004690968|nr:DNA topoisomerase [Caldalkalibacillus mannanilyticus]